MKKILFFILLFVTFLNAQIELNNESKTPLLSLQKISVTIGGDFFVTGSFPALANERVDELLTRLYTQAKQAAFSAARDEITLAKVSEEFEDYSLRNITLKRFDGTEKILDLARFRLNGDFENNPYLKNGDLLLLPMLDLERNFIEIDGAINNPKKIQFVEGDKLSDVIFLAQGINKAYENVTHAEISRLSYDGNEEEILRVDILDEFELQRGDRIKILADETQKKSFKVLVLGEVNKPGFIYIKKDGTKISEVIKKAGGFTEVAWQENVKYISGISADIMFNENNLTELELIEIENKIRLEQFRLSRLSNLNVEDTLYFQLENELNVYNSGRIINFTDISDLSSTNLIVKDGDVIHIPKFEEYIYVFGQVPHKGKIQYVKNKDYKYYIEKAGGLVDQSKDEIMLIKGTTKNWLSIEKDSINIEPGDFLWVPKEPVRGFDFYLKQVGSVAGILGSVATLILLIDQLNK